MTRIIQRDNKNMLVNIKENTPVENPMQQRGSWIILALLISAFGPYIPKAHGLRLEHIVIYGLAGFFVLIWMNAKSRSSDRHARAITVLMILATLWTILSTVLAGSGFNAKVVAGIENYLQPIALLIVLTVVLRRINADAKRLLNLAAVTICVLLTFNSLLSLATIFFDTWPLIQYFVGDVSGYQGWSIWGDAASHGRYPGIFNQPIECGLAHSLGLLSWVYLNVSVKRKRLVNILLFIGVFTGGILSISKVFLMGGIPLAVIYWFWGNRRSVVAFLGLILIAITMGVGLSWIAPYWLGFERLAGYFNSSEVEANQGALSFYTSDRFGGGGSFIINYFNKTLQQAPLQGFGFDAWEGGPLDNAYIEFMYQGGVVAFLLYLTMLVIIASAARNGLRRRIPEGKLLALLFVLIVGAGFGAPVLTINRASIILWVLLILSLNLCTEKNNGDAGQQELMRRSA